MFLLMVRVWKIYLPTAARLRSRRRAILPAPAIATVDCDLALHISDGCHTSGDCASVMTASVWEQAASLNDDSDCTLVMPYMMMWIGHHDDDR